MSSVGSLERRRAVLYWTALCSLAVLCCVLARLQYRWIGEISRAEENQLKEGLQTNLARTRDGFNRTIETASAALMPSDSEVEKSGREGAYAARYERWRESDSGTNLFRRFAIAIPSETSVNLRIFDGNTGRFEATDWPGEWLGLRDQLVARLTHTPPRPMDTDTSNVFEIPRFGRRDSRGPRPAEQDWLILELNVEYVRSSLIPQLLSAHLGTSQGSGYRAEVFVRGDPARLIYQSHPDRGERIGNAADASIGLFSVRHSEMLRRGPPPGPRPAHGPPPGPPSGFGPGRAGEDGRWELVAQSEAGSLGALVERARRRNLAVSAGILMLLLATVALLLQFSRKAQQLADLQMSFVATVSHELRTPLTVIRTAAFNLKGRVAHNPEQVERYGALIQDESEKLTALVEQILRFALTRAGRAISEKTPVLVEAVIDDLLESRKHILEVNHLDVEQRIEPQLPLVLGDEIALRHAIQNLLDNAIKYGANGTGWGSHWIGISVSKVISDGPAAIEIRVADRGPGIPADEQPRIFDAFFRGRSATQDQIHGTGLGLSLVKKIVEAHNGTICVKSEPGKGTEFVIRIPAAPEEVQNEFAHSFG